MGVKALEKRPYMYLLRGGAVFILDYIIFKLSLVVLLAISAPGDSVFHDLPLWSLYLVSTLAFLFAFNSLVGFFTVYNREERITALEEGRRDGFFAELGAVLRSPSFILETSVVGALTLLFSLFSGFSEIPDMIFFSLEIPEPLRLFTPIIILFPILFAVSLLSRYEVRRYWFYLDKTNSLDVLEKRVRLIARFLFILIGYPTIFPFVPLLLYVAFTFVSIFVQLSVLLSVAGVIGIIVGILLIIVVISYLSAMNKRKKFLKALAEICKEKGYEISEIKKPYLSFFKHSPGESFTVSRGEERYSCKLVSSVRRGVPLYLSSDRHGYFLHRFGFKNHHISLSHNIIWGHDSSYQKIAIIDPMPKQVIAIAQNGTTRPLAPADKVWDTLLYDSKTLIGVIDRDCLGRANSSD